MRGRFAAVAGGGGVVTERRPDDFYSVTVYDRMGQIVTIETGMLAGRDIGPHEETVIRDAIESLSGFIGLPGIASFSNEMTTAIKRIAARISGDHPAIAAELEQHATLIESTLRELRDDMAKSLKERGSSGFTATVHVERWWFQLSTLIARFEQTDATPDPRDVWIRKAVGTAAPFQDDPALRSLDQRCGRGHPMFRSSDSLRLSRHRGHVGSRLEPVGEPVGEAMRTLRALLNAICSLPWTLFKTIAYASERRRYRRQDRGWE